MLFFKLTILAIGLYMAEAQTDGNVQSLGAIYSPMTIMRCGSQIGGVGELALPMADEEKYLHKICHDNMKFAVSTEQFPSANALRIFFYLGEFDSMQTGSWENVAEVFRYVPTGYQEIIIEPGSIADYIPIGVDWNTQPCGMRLLGVAVIDDSQSSPPTSPSSYTPVSVPCQQGLSLTVDLSDPNAASLNIFDGMPLMNIFSQIKIENMGSGNINPSSELFPRLVAIIGKPHFSEGYMDPDNKILAVGSFLDGFSAGAGLQLSDFTESGQITFEEGAVCGAGNLIVALLPYMNGQFQSVKEFPAFFECSQSATQPEDYRESKLLNELGSSVLVQIRKSPYERSTFFYYDVNSWTEVYYNTMMYTFDEIRLSKLATYGTKQSGKTNDMVKNLKQLFPQGLTSGMQSPDDEIFWDLQATGNSLRDSTSSDEDFLSQLEQKTYSHTLSSYLYEFNQTLFQSLKDGLNHAQHMSDVEVLRKEVRHWILVAHRDYVQMDRERGSGNYQPSTSVVYDFGYLYGLVYRTQDSHLRHLADMFMNILRLTTRYYTGSTERLCPLRLLGLDASTVMAVAYTDYNLGYEEIESLELPLLLSGIGVNRVYGNPTSTQAEFEDSCGLAFGYDYNHGAANYRWYNDDKYVYVGMKGETGEWHFKRNMVFYCKPCQYMH